MSAMLRATAVAYAVAALALAHLLVVLRLLWQVELGVEPRSEGVRG